MSHAATASKQAPVKKLLIANRGEIAIRIMSAAAELGVETVAIHSDDEAGALHPRKADHSFALGAEGARAYLDAARIVEIAKQAGCDAVHPGYGFLSENAEFARACEAAGILFVGPVPDTLELFGNKAKARGLAEECDVPLTPGTGDATTLEEGLAFFDSLGEDAAVMIKAVAGGGGRGMRPVDERGEFEKAFERCKSEARMAFGSEEVYVERLIRHARHIEIQVVGDGKGGVTHLWERECSLQRRNQKVVEVAPSPSLDPALRDRLIAAAVKMAGHAKYRSLGTFEFLVDQDAATTADAFAFIEANPRLQVEHTVTEEVTGVDLVKTQLRIAGGATLADLRLADAPPAPRGYAIQLRINMETMAKDGSIRPSGGTLSHFDMPFGPGVRVDTLGFAGYRTSPNFDSLLAKLICHSDSPDYEDVVNRAYRALCEFRIEGVKTNQPFLQNLLRHEAFVANAVDTKFIERHAAELVGEGPVHRALHVSAETDKPAAERRHAGARLGSSDPLAVLNYGKAAEDDGGDVDARAEAARAEAPDGTVPLLAPVQGTIVSLSLEAGAQVHEGKQVLVMEAMKMEHVITADTAGTIREIVVAPGETVYEGDVLVYIEAGAVDAAEAAVEEEVDLDHIRGDLAESIERHRMTLDEARPEAVARRRKTKQRTTRENLDDLLDADSFVEYGALTVAARRLRNSMDELIKRTPADGLVTGIGKVNGDRFAPEHARVGVLAYDYTVLAGTQGKKNHEKTDRLIEVVKRRKLPLLFFTEGGGGRPGDTDVVSAGGLTTPTFHQFASLSGLVPLIGINSGRCFAGNAAILGCCDVIIATENSNIGMGGPAMIEGGGLGVFRPEEIGPMSVQVANGTVDIAVKDEAEAVAVAKQYLSYFQGPVSDWDCADQRWLRRAIPENRLRIYDVRKVIETMCDTGSVLEIRRGFGHGMITCFARVEGKPLAIVANNPSHLGGAIDSPAADKAARFMQICNAFDIPVLFLCDTPGNMVGPEAEKTGLVRHCSRLFVVGANLSVPFFTVVLRKGYGLGAQGMAGGGFHNPLFLVSWPTGEFGGMGLEGAIKLGHRDQLAAIEDPEERQLEYQRMVDDLYEKGKAISSASLFEIDDVIDPAETRRWIASALDTPYPKEHANTGKKQPWIDAC